MNDIVTESTSTCIVNFVNTVAFRMKIATSSKNALPSCTPFSSTHLKSFIMLKLIFVHSSCCKVSVMKMGQLCQTVKCLLNVFNILIIMKMLILKVYLSTCDYSSNIFPEIIID